MNKYKIVSIVLSVALLVHIVRLAWVFVAPSSGDGVSSASQTVLHNILQRKSVRAYTDRAVSHEQLDTLIRAAMAAPTGRDMRPWHFIVLEGRHQLSPLAEQLPYAKMLAEAQAAVVVCGDMSVTDKEGNPSRNWTFDCSAATENLLLQAEAMGLGAVWTGVYPYDERIEAVKQALHLPDHLIPLNVIPIGYPKGDPQPKDKYDPAKVEYRN
ncbi:MAG: nitroreductase family protein [Alloprevotella sp.]|nr:nitroreductase family protein [Bacteroidales bacterium]MCI7314716.1 nitroreductase family protein [Bacteroidales bacterium]MDD6584471.1 nitroreductase family protein [Bacteroidales bacterium]